MNGFQRKKAFVVTIDGPAGSGKSTVAKRAALETGLRYLDTGKLYRAIALYLSRQSIPPSESESLKGILSRLSLKLEDDVVIVCGQNVTNEIHTPAIDSIVSLYAALPSVRERLLDLQRMQAEAPGLVADGRDMGSVVFPDADLKIYLTADSRERARRRYLEQSSKGDDISMEKALSIVLSRDETDSHRTIAPLVIPEGAVVLDTTGTPPEEVIDEVVRLMKEISRRESEEDLADVR